VPDHRSIVDAIRRGDPGAARLAVATLLIQAEADAMEGARQRRACREPRLSPPPAAAISATSCGQGVEKVFRRGARPDSIDLAIGRNEIFASSGDTRGNRP